jgi:hypothetical protein
MRKASLSAWLMRAGGIKSSAKLSSISINLNNAEKNLLRKNEGIWVSIAIVCGKYAAQTLD